MQHSDTLTLLDDVRDLLGDVLGLGERARRLQEDSPLLGSLPELDSMAVIGVITALEERFGIEVGDDEINARAFRTLGSLAAFVQGKLV